MLVIPAIDLLDGQVVRLTEGNYGDVTRYSRDPVALAGEFEAAGAEWLHVVDLDGARSGASNPLNLKICQAIRTATTIRIEWGGGLRSREAMLAASEAGADRFVLGSVLVKDPAFAQRTFEEFGDQVVAGIDTRDGIALVSGWTEGSRTTGFELGRELAKSGCPRMIYTDVRTDGRLLGPNLAAVATMSQIGVPLIASGGVASLADIVALAAIPGVEGAIVGKALYEGRVSLAEAVLAARPTS